MRVKSPLKGVKKTLCKAFKRPLKGLGEALDR